MHPVLDAGRRGDQGEVELALEPLLDDLHVQQPEEAAAEPEPERRRRLGLVGDRCVAELQLLDALAQVLEVVAVDRVQAAEHHRLRIAVAGQGLGRAAERGRDRLTAAGLADQLDAGDQVADLARTELLDRRRHRAAHADLDDLVVGLGLHEQHLVGTGHAAVHHPHAGHDAAVLVVLAVEDERLQRRVRIAGRGRDALDDGVEQLAHALAGLGRDAQDLIGGDAEHVLDLGGEAIRVGRREIDLVEGGDDLEVVLQRQVAVGQRLGLDALGGVDDEHHALAGGQRAADLVAEVDVAGRVDQVEGVALPVDAHVLGLDRDAPLTLQIHRVQVLLAHVAGVDGVGQLEDAVAQRRLAVVDVGDDGEVADAGQIHANHGGYLARWGSDGGAVSLSGLAIKSKRSC